VALQAETGRRLWHFQTVHHTYEVRGRQYVVIAAGGGSGNRATERADTVAGDAFVAYALP
jgi:glucose dehydrogenase